KMKKHRRGDRPSLISSYSNESHPPGQHMLKNVPKKRQRLRGQAVLLPRLAMQCIISQQRVQGLRDLHLDLRALGLSNRTANTAVKARENTIFALCHRQHVPEKRKRRRGGLRQIPDAPELGV